MVPPTKVGKTPNKPFFLSFFFPFSPWIEYQKEMEIKNFPPFLLS